MPNPLFDWYFELKVALVLSGETLAPYVPRFVAGWAGEGARHRAVDCTLVSVDVSGFTALSERLAAHGKLGAEELIRRISDCYEGLISTTVSYGGDVLKFRGDALLIVFTGPQHEVRATAAAIDMQAAIAARGEMETMVGPIRLGIACGIHSGECDFFLVGSSHGELIVAGPAASAVLRLEDLAEGGEILVSAQTAAQLEPQLLDAEREGARLLAPDALAPAVGPPPPEQTLDKPLDDLVPGPLRPLLAAGATDPEHRQATVAFIKFSGTDVLGGGAAEPIAALGAQVGSVADEFGITWLESDIDYNGGKLYLVAGAPSSGGEDEERMLRALRRIVDADHGLPVCAGVNRGRVFVGDIGSDLRRTYAVMGDTVNVAARLTGKAQKGQILASDAVLERSAARWETVGTPMLMKGKARALTAHAIGALLHERMAEEELLPLVGREEELAAMQEAIDAARRRHATVVELVGEPGIGKSRLVAELKLRALGFQQLSTRCEPYSMSTPYAPFRPLLRSLVGIVPEDSAEAAGAQLADWVRAVMPDVAQWLPLLATPFHAEVASTPEVDETDPQFRHERLLETVEVFLSRLLLMPTLLVFEDAHWLDDASRDLLAHLTASPTPRPWVTCVTRRPEGPTFASGTNGSLLELTALPPESATQFALQCAGDESLSAAELARLTERSGGNPLFVRELLRARSTGSLEGELPVSVESMITARIDRLEPLDRRLLRCAAVIGATFDRNVLADVLAAEEGQLGELDRLDNLADFVSEEDATTLRFKHDLFRTAAYEGLSYARRRELHALVAEALERRDGDVGLLALHFREAGDKERAWLYGVAAGDAARDHYSTDDAIEHYERAMEVAEELESVQVEELARVAEALGDAARLGGRNELAGQSLRRARNLLEDDPGAQARLLGKEGMLQEEHGAYDEAARGQRAALELLDEADVDEPALRAQLEVDFAGVCFRQGNYAECVAAAKRAVEHAEKGAARAKLAHAYYLLDIAHTRLGRPQAEYRELALPIYEEIGDLVGQAKVLNNLGYGAYYEGRWDEAVSYYRRSAHASARTGDVRRAAEVRNNEGEILSDQGRLEEAEALFDEALRSWRAAGYAAGVAFATGNRGRAAARAGRFEDAHALLMDALARFEELGATELVLETSARIAECFVLEGHHEEALRFAKDALAYVREIEGLAPLEAMLERLVGYAIHQSRSRRPAEAQPHFAESLRIARAANARYEIALTLRALADTTGDAAAGAEAQTLLTALGVASLPYVPLP